MPIILDGKKARESYRQKLANRAASLRRRPSLAIIQIGNNAESSIYIEQKKKFGESIGVNVLLLKFPENEIDEKIKSEILRLNADTGIDGMILQLPIPARFDKDKLVNAISPKKDVDGLTAENQELLTQGRQRFIPATAKGIVLLLDFYGISVKEKKIAVFGRSKLVGYPTAKILEQRGAKVFVCHSQTPDPKKISKECDIVIVAIGKPRLIDTSYIKDGAVVIDVGINSVAGKKFEEEIPKRKLIGDVDFVSVSPVASAISPVPGGIGPMTVLSLFDNVIESAESSQS